MGGRHIQPQPLFGRFDQRHPVALEYAVSNVVFLLLLARPIGEKLERIKTKYGLFNRPTADPLFSQPVYVCP